MERPSQANQDLNVRKKCGNIEKVQKINPARYSSTVTSAEVKIFGRYLLMFDSHFSNISLPLMSEGGFHPL